jgi:hypothetical protein
VVPALPPGPLGDDEPRPLENPEVLHGRASIVLRKGGTQLSRCPGLVPEQIEDPPARAVGERLEDAVVRLVIDLGLATRHVMSL